MSMCGVGWGGSASQVTFFCLHFFLSSTLLTFSSNFRHALDATLWTFSSNFQRALAAKILPFQATSNTLLILRSQLSQTFSNTSAATLLTCSSNFQLIRKISKDFCHRRVFTHRPTVVVSMVKMMINHQIWSLHHKLSDKPRKSVPFATFVTFVTWKFGQGFGYHPKVTVKVLKITRVPLESDWPQERLRYP